MNRLIPAAVITLGAVLAAGVAPAENAVYSCVNANGVESLTNVPNGGNCTQLFTYKAPPPPANEVATPPPATPSLADSTPAASAEVAAVAVPVERVSRQRDLVNGQPPVAQPRTPLEQRLAQRRADAIEQTRAAYNSDLPLVGMNRAVNRRYLMTNRAAYQMAIGGVQN
jgi:hypothetical protein